MRLTLISAFTVSLGIWFVFLFLTFFGTAFSGVYSSVWRPMFFYYPLAAFLAILLLLFKRTYFVSVFPILLLIFIGIILAINTAIAQSKIRNAARTNDTSSIQYDLDGVAKISVPQSFTQNTHDLIARNFYSLDLSGEQFTYSFVRDAYGDIGGTREPVSLGIRFYKEGSTTPSLNNDYYNYNSFEGVSFQEDSKNIKLGYLLNSSPKVEPFERIGVLIYTDSSGKYRIYMTYWDSYLTDSAALDMFKRISQSVVVESTLDKRIKVLGDQFYKENPDKVQ
ncbi:MAG: hypothetical protein JWN49_500 [Parcubacteria group bacterium]|nr:hypothetical protein [Parcubacteria group bacterium]